MIKLSEKEKEYLNKRGILEDLDSSINLGSFTRKLKFKNNHSWNNSTSISQGSINFENFNTGNSKIKVDTDNKSEWYVHDSDVSYDFDIPTDYSTTNVKLDIDWEVVSSDGSNITYEVSEKYKENYEDIKLSNSLNS